MKKRKVLYVITKSVWGGAQRYVFDLATNLPKDRFEIAVAAGGSGLLIEKLEKAGVRTIAIPALTRDINVFKEARSFWSLLKIFKNERPDIIHLNSSKIGGIGAAAAFASRLLYPDLRAINPRVIFTVHGWGFHESRPRWQRAAILFFSRLSAFFQHHIIHINKNDLYATHTLSIAPERKAEYIPLGTNQQSMFSRARARGFFYKKIGLNKNAVWIGTVAELTRNKGLDHLLDAIKQVKLQITNYKLQTIIIGEGEERKKLQNQINSLGLQNTTHLAGFIPDAARYLKAFDVFVLPSLKEGSPYTILEAMRAGIPIVATNVGGVPEIIEHDNNGFLVPPANPQALASALNVLACDKNKQKEFAGNGAKKIRQQAGFPEMIRKTADLYELGSI